MIYAYCLVLAIVFLGFFSVLIKKDSLSMILVSLIINISLAVLFLFASFSLNNTSGHFFAITIVAITVVEIAVYLVFLKKVDASEKNVEKANEGY